MMTPGTTVPPADAESARPPLRLRMGRVMGVDRLDGGWWPHSRDLPVELADLVDNFPPECGRVVRALFSPPDWEPAPRRVRVAGGQIKIGSFPRDDTHLIELTTSDRRVLHVLVIPPGLTEDQGSEALLAAATAGNVHTAAELLATATEHPDVDPADHWADDGGSWWGDRGAPSFRGAAAP